MRSLQAHRRGQEAVSYRRIESVEYDCDGKCGEKKIVADHLVGTSTRDLPPGWVELRLSPEASKATSGDSSKHFCATCFSLMTLPLWNRERQFQILSLLSEDELDDWNLDGLFERLKVAEKKRLQQEAKVGTGG